MLAAVESCDGDVDSCDSKTCPLELKMARRYSSLSWCCHGVLSSEDACWSHIAVVLKSQLMGRHTCFELLGTIIGGLQGCCAKGQLQQAITGYGVLLACE